MIPLRFIDRIPNPWNTAYVQMLFIGAVAAMAANSLRVGSLDYINAAIALAAVVILQLAARAIGIRGRKGGTGIRRIMPEFAAYVLASVALLFVALSRIPSTIAGYAVVLLPVVLFSLAFYPQNLRPNRYSILFPLLFAAMILAAAVLFGHPGRGGFPAMLVLLLSAVILTTRRIEADLAGTESDDLDLVLQTRHHRTLNLVSAGLFLFGVMSLWPWLGMLYGSGYLWILILGVLAPMLYVWGKLRQPHDESAVVALLRFNRLVPYLGFVLLLAIAVG